jgi:parvulin-like peptidyl-prolyl isomerase
VRRRCLGEPLLQFLLAGLLLFTGHAVLNANTNPREQPGRIELTEDDLRQMTVAWLPQGRPAPTPTQLRSLVESKVREEVLYREALALGLDKEDTILKRRLAQKMEFLAEDASPAPEPTTEELRAWFESHSERFALPARATFRHLYFSPDRRGERARDDAGRTLEKLAGTPADSPAVAALADPFMFQDFYGDRPYEQLVALFVASFAQALLQLPPRSWQGPIQSGYGWHLVWLDSITPARVPSFDAVESDVRAEWIADQRAAARERAFETMRARYQVVLPATVTDAGALAATASR